MLLQDLAEASEVQVLQTRETVTAFEPQLGYLPQLARKGITNGLWTYSKLISLTFLQHALLA